MKNLLPLLFTISLLISCEDVVEVPLQKAEPRLIVDAIIEWEKGTSGSSQSIKLSRTRGFFEEDPIPVTGAEVLIENGNGIEFPFEEDKAGTYTTKSFLPEFGQTYTMTIELDGQTYTAMETMTPVSDIEFIQQNDAGGFSGEDTELKVFYTDKKGEDNFYLFKYFAPFLAYPDLSTFDDEFNDGNRIFGIFSNEDLAKDMDVRIKLYGISKDYYNFLEILLAQAGSAGGPFETQPATVRGNIKNTQNPDELVFGYFGLSEIDQVIYTIQ